LPRTKEKVDKKEYAICKRVAATARSSSHCEGTVRTALGRYSFTLRRPRQRRVTSTEARIAARLDALRRARGNDEQLGDLIREELNRAPARKQAELLGYFERWLDRQLELLLEESAPVTRTIQ
jgi:hypothetical protein